MYKMKLLGGAIGATLWAFGAGAVELPTGPNSAFVARTCGSCHDLDMVVDAAGLNREGWNGTIDEMVGYGLKVSPDEKSQLLEYLTAFLGPDAKKK
jgi:hypothetical protein